MVFRGTITIEWNGQRQPLKTMVFRWLATIGPTMEWLHTIVEVYPEENMTQSRVCSVAAFVHKWADSISRANMAGNKRFRLCQQFMRIVFWGKMFWFNQLQPQQFFNQAIAFCVHHFFERKYLWLNLLTSPTRVLRAEDPWSLHNFTFFLDSLNRTLWTMSGRFYQFFPRKAVLVEHSHEYDCTE